jgi:hypothetical protein
MSTVVESYVGLEFIMATLQNDATYMSLSPSGVWRGIAPVGTVMPFGSITLQSGNDVLTANARRIFVNAIYQLRATGLAGNTAAIAALAAQIDTLLERPPYGYAAGGVVISAYREATIWLDEDIGSDKYTHIGGLYRLQIQSM